MRMPVIEGVIDRRILVNYRVDPAVVQQILPAPFRPQLVGEWAIAGICLIRLRNVRPQGWPAWLGIDSENAAHRFAVEWDDDGQTRHGVYIPRRDTSSRLNGLAGGRVFPGLHHLARFDVREQTGVRERTGAREQTGAREEGDRFQIVIDSSDDQTHIRLDAARPRQPVEWNRSSIFRSLADSSEFFAAGSLGYSPAANGCCEGLELCTTQWHVEPLEVRAVKSSYFDDRTRFPAGSIEFDHALLMQNISHTWHARGVIKTDVIAVQGLIASRERQ